MAGSGDRLSSLLWSLPWSRREINVSSFNVAVPQGNVTFDIFHLLTTLFTRLLPHISLTFSLWCHLLPSRVTPCAHDPFYPSSMSFNTIYGFTALSKFRQRAVSDPPRPKLQPNLHFIPSRPLLSRISGYNDDGENRWMILGQEKVQGWFRSYTSFCS
jgi:hypothetical protein